MQKFQNIEENCEVRLGCLNFMHEVSIGSGSDRVSLPANSILPLLETRSLSLPVPSSLLCDLDHNRATAVLEKRVTLTYSDRSRGLDL